MGIQYFFLFLLKNIDCGYSLEPPRRGGSNDTHNLCFEQKHEKYQNFVSEKFHCLVLKLSISLNRHVFVMCTALWLLFTRFPIAHQEISKSHQRLFARSININNIRKCYYNYYTEFYKTLLLNLSAYSKCQAQCDFREHYSYISSKQKFWLFQTKRKSYKANHNCSRRHFDDFLRIFVRPDSLDMSNLTLPEK